MNDFARRTALGLTLFAACATAAVRAQTHQIEDATDIAVSGSTPESIIIAWPTYSYRLARMMIAKYGQPSQALDARLVWLDNGPWKRTVVYRSDPDAGVFRAGKGRLEQTVAYRVPPDKVGVLAKYDKDLDVDAEHGRLTARSDSETANFLALNLADEVVKGRRAPGEAAEYRGKMEKLAPSGKSSSYLDGLMFVRGDEFANPESPD